MVQPLKNFLLFRETEFKLTSNNQDCVLILKQLRAIHLLDVQIGQIQSVMLLGDLQTLQVGQIQSLILVDDLHALQVG